MLVLDLFVFHKNSHEISIKEALGWSAFWISLALIFNWGIYAGWVGDYLPEVRHQKALEFLTGYLVEESLSIDNLFVFALVFSFFKVPDSYRHKVLFWGILGAIVMRAIMIIFGVALIDRFSWIIYVFGAILVFSGIKMFFSKEAELHPEKNLIIVLAKKYFPFTHEYFGERFFVRIDKKLWATPLLLVLISIETTDLIFAVDSIPAVLAISKDPFIVYTSNIFAILGLRALYFALAGIMKLFHFLHYGLSIVLVFIGGKMLISGFYHIPIEISLGVVAGVIGLSIVLSLWFKENKEETTLS
jgi:tellurite resistance protein TerC